MTQSREDLLNELCHITWRRNELNWMRQRARSKVNYYERIMRAKYNIKSAQKSGHELSAYWLELVPAKYADSKKGELQIHIKKHLAEQLEIESNIHELTHRTHKRVVYLLNTLGYRQIRRGTNRVLALVPKEAHVAGGCECHPAIDEKEITRRSEDYLIESILLRGKDPT
jgi:hypothetical protein